MNERVKEFIKKQTCASICCVDENGSPYCFSCYYAFNAENGLIYFKSSVDTRHSKILLTNPLVAGTILPDKLSKLITKGIQWQGELLEEHHPLASDAFAIYHQKNPMAITVNGRVFTISMNIVKMTDSQLGFGKKSMWKREETEVKTIKNNQTSK